MRNILNRLVHLIQATWEREMKRSVVLCFNPSVIEQEIPNFNRSEVTFQIVSTNQVPSTSAYSLIIHVSNNQDFKVDYQEKVVGLILVKYSNLSGYLVCRLFEPFRCKVFAVANEVSHFHLSVTVN